MPGACTDNMIRFVAEVFGPKSTEDLDEVDNVEENIWFYTD